MLEGSHLAAVVEGPRLVPLHVDAVADTVQHIQQTRLGFLSWRFAVQTLPVLESIRETTPQQDFLVGLGVRGGRRRRCEAAVNWTNLAVKTEVLEVEGMSGHAAAIGIGLWVSQGLLTGPDFEMGTEGVVVLDLFLLSLGRHQVLLLVDHSFHPTNAFKGMIGHLLYPFPRRLLHSILWSPQMNCRIGIVSEGIGIQEAMVMGRRSWTSSGGCLSRGVFAGLLFVCEHVNIMYQVEERRIRATVWSQHQ